MARSFCALFMYAIFLTLTGCGASVEEQAPPTEAPQMNAEEQTNYEEEMKKMREQQNR